jgi:hypothetical protein
MSREIQEECDPIHKGHVNASRDSHALSFYARFGKLPAQAGRVAYDRWACVA